MGRHELQMWLRQNSGFNRQLDRVIIDSVAQQFPYLKKINGTQEHDWHYLLMCASILSESDKEECQDAALRIAQYCLCSPERTTETQKDAAGVILDSMANRPTIELAEERKYILPDLYSRLPFSLKLDWLRRGINNSISLSDGKPLFVNRFQRNFWDNVHENDWISISAPTSAGKSFIIKRYLIETIKQHKNPTIIYIVPTRALIHQIETELKAFAVSEKIDNVSVASLPLDSVMNEEKANVFVFTQERLQIFLNSYNYEIKIDLLIVDEAHKVGDGTRGVLLQQVLESVISYNAKAKIIFASPLTKNPELFLQDTYRNIKVASLLSEDTMVNQNLLWASQLPRTSKHWQLDLCTSNTKYTLGEFELSSRPSVSKRLPFIAHKLGSQNGGNLVYANTPSEAERAAIILYDLLSDAPRFKTHSEIKDSPVQ